MDRNKYSVAKVIYNEEISTGIYKLTVAGSFQAKPGQFYMLRAWENQPLLSRPISVHSVDNRQEGKGQSITFVYAVVGEGTELLSKLRSEDEVKLTGALGNGFDTKALKGKVALVTGGIGVAPMYYVAQELKKNQEVTKVDLYAGFRNETYLVSEFQGITCDVKVSTENGSCGHKGYVTEMLKVEDYDVVLCCGPEIMMNKVVSLCKEKNVKVYVSMEKHMACGIGACLVCTCKTKEGNKRSCKDGPVFSGEELC